MGTCQWMNNNFDIIYSSLVNLGILVELKAKQLEKEFKLLIVYGPYSDKRKFWENLVELGVLGGNIVLVGDMNFIISLREMWGGGEGNERSNWGVFLVFYTNSYTLTLPCPMGFSSLIQSLRASPSTLRNHVTR